MTLGAFLLVEAVLIATMPLAARGEATADRVYVANCGNTSYLAFKPKSWSSGCTGGSANVRRVKWRIWTRHRAFGTGPAWLRINVNTPLYRTRGKVRLYRIRTCKSKQGTERRYFTRARWSAYYRAGNPFHLSEGWHHSTFKPFGGQCTLARF